MPLAGLNDLDFGCWDIFEDNAYEAAEKAGVLDMPLLEQLKEPLSAIRPMKAVFDQKFVKRINGPNVKTGGTKMDKAEMLMDDIRQFQKRTGVSRMAMIWCGSTEVYHEAAPVHATLKDFECGLHEERSGDLAQPDLRLRRAEAGRAVRQRRAASDHGHAGAARAGARTTTFRFAARITRPARRS